MRLDERAIREVHSAWIEAVNAGDLGRLFTLMADDCLFLGPGQEPVGRDGFSRGFLAVYRKQSDGRWLLASDAHTLSAVE